MTWFAIDCNIWTNPKVKKLADVLRVDQEAAVCRLARIWSWAMLAESEDGEITHIPDEELAGIARWKKKPSDLAAALVECGFVDVRDGRRFLHGWGAINGKFQASKRRDRERKSTDIPK